VGRNARNADLGSSGMSRSGKQKEEFTEVKKQSADVYNPFTPKF